MTLKRNSRVLEAPSQHDVTGLQSRCCKMLMSAFTLATWDVDADEARHEAGVHGKSTIFQWQQLGCLRRA